MRTRDLLVVLGLIVHAPSARAQTAPRSLEAGGFVGVHGFPEDSELGNSWASEQTPHTAVVLGGRFGLTLLPDLAPASAIDPQIGIESELALALASTGESVDGGRESYFSPVFGWRAHAIFRLRTTGALHPHLVVGGGGESVASQSPFMWNDTDAEFHWGPGLTWQASKTWIARADLRHELTAGRMDDPISTFELHIGVERSFELGGREVLPPASEPKPEPPPQPPAVADSDGDGILDPGDKCVTEPEDVDQFEDEDGCPELDNDKDGVPDTADACPQVAEDADKFQDEDGCPDLDDDGDGILDPADQCRLEPEALNGFQDDDGCPDELPAAVKQFTGTIEGITFGYGSAKIRKPSKKLLVRAAKVLREYPEVRVRIEGHTDPKGLYDKNKALSLRRAEAVKWYLVDQGITADRIETVGMGPDQPRGDNKTAKGRARNRRIEFHLVIDVAPPQPQTQPAPQPTPAPAP